MWQITFDGYQTVIATWTYDDGGQFVARANVKDVDPREFAKIAMGQRDEDLKRRGDVQAKLTEVIAGIQAAFDELAKG
jgi:hypothetical protein